MKNKTIPLAVICSLILTSTACSTINSNQLGTENTSVSITENDTFEIKEV